MTNNKNTVTESDGKNRIFDESALAFINHHEKDVSGEVSAATHEVDVLWNALDLLAGGEFPELTEFDEKTNQTTHIEVDEVTRFFRKLPSIPQYWGAIAAMLLVALVVPASYMGIPTYYVVEKGQQTTVTLLDGSSIALGSNTQISVQEGWGRRSVVLEKGNAYFAVAPNKDKPFSITAGTSTVTVLGTSFSVYRKQEQVEVVVESGKVNLSDASTNYRAPINVDLVKNQKASIKLGEALQLSDNVNVDDATAWRRGFVHFKQETLETIVTRMSDFYQTPIYLRNNQRRNLQLSGVFKTDDIDSFLVGIQRISNVRVERNAGGAVYIY